MLVLAGIIIFFIIEKTLGYISQYSEHQSHGHHGHSHGTRITNDKSASKSSNDSDSDKDATKAVVSSDKDGEKTDERRCHIQPGAILSLMADAAHNFTDGLYSNGNSLCTFPVSLFSVT